MKKYLDKWFGIRVAIVTAYALRSYMKRTHQFIFPANTSEEKIRASLSWYKDGIFEGFTVEDINVCRRKDIQPPPKDHYTVLKKSNGKTYYYD